MSRVIVRRCVFSWVVFCGLLVASAAAADDLGVELVEIRGADAMIARGLPVDQSPIIAVRPSPGFKSSEFGPEEFGILDRDFATVFGNAFVATSSAAQWGTTTGNALYCPAGATFQFFDAQVHVPIGAVLSGIRSWGYDSDAGEDIWLYFWEECQPSFGSGEPVLIELINGTISSGSPGEFSTFTAFPQRNANTFECVYRVRIALGDGSCNGFSLRFYKARLQYYREISPAPAVATFSDVPVGAFGFQHVEALAASGITGGCGGGNFCPNQPLTRVQMAVFLAKALGLHWSEDSF